MREYIKKYTFIEENDVGRTGMDKIYFSKNETFFEEKINRTDMNMVRVGEYLKKYEYLYKKTA